MTEPGTSSGLRLEVFCSPMREIGTSGETFSPTTSTLIIGESEVVLVDAQLIVAEVEALGDRLAATGKTLTSIFVTHGHGDHCFGASRLQARFPGARFVATPAVADYVRTQLQQETAGMQALFGEDMATLTGPPEPLTEGALHVDGHELLAIDVGQGDIAPSAVLHVPALDAVVAGDVAYNGIHQMLALGGPDQWQLWLDSLSTIEQLQPTTVVAGHKKPEASDDAAPVLAGSRTYIEDFTDAFHRSSTAEQLVEAMRAAYPDHGNLTTLRYSAHRAIKHHK